MSLIQYNVVPAIVLERVGKRGQVRNMIRYQPISCYYQMRPLCSASKGILKDSLAFLLTHITCYSGNCSFGNTHILENEVCLAFPTSNDTLWTNDDGVRNCFCSH